MGFDKGEQRIDRGHSLYNSLKGSNLARGLNGDIDVATLLVIPYEKRALGYLVAKSVPSSRNVPRDEEYLGELG